MSVDNTMAGELALEFLEHLEQQGEAADLERLFMCAVVRLEDGRREVRWVAKPGRDDALAELLRSILSSVESGDTVWDSMPLPPETTDHEQD